MLVSIEHAFKKYGEKMIVDDAHFYLDQKDKVALIGVNGTGKSTLLKMIAGQEAFQGQVMYQKDIKINYLSQNPVYQNGDTILETVKKQIDTKDLNLYEIKTMLHRFGMEDENRLVDHLSGGQLKRVALAIALMKPCDLLILDEPTNHIDNSMIEYLEKYLIKWKKGLLMVTHDRYFLERVCHRIVELSQGHLYNYEANYSQYLELKQMRIENDLNAQRKRKNFLKKELEWVRAGVQARTTKSKDRLQRFEQLSQIADVAVEQKVQLMDVSRRLGKKTIILHDISHSFGEHLLFQPFSYTFKRYDRIGILGDNGTGKSTLLNIITQQIKPTSGSVEIGETVHFGYFKQGYEDLPLNKKVIDYIQEVASYQQFGKETLSAKNMCERFLFDAKMQHTLISRLSGGERRRLYLLRVLMTMPNVLVLDEPTNDLDIDTLTILEDYLDSFAGMIIVVSHDRYFLDRICDGLFILQNQTLRYQNGGYSSLIDSQTQKEKKESNGAHDYRKAKQSRYRMPYLEKKELETIEGTIQDLEKQVSALEEQLNSLEDYQEIAKICYQRDRLNEELEQKNERFLELLELKEKEEQS